MIFLGILDWVKREGRDKGKGVVKRAQTAFVDSLVERSDVQYELQALAFVEFDLGPKRSGEKEGDWP